MTIELALDRTKSLRSQSDKEWHEYLDFVIDILEKAKPRKAYKNKHATMLGVGVCMRCGKGFASMQNYCSYCGQKQDWGRRN